jgi:hypothetical protein
VPLATFEHGHEDQIVNDLNKLAGVDVTKLEGAVDIIAKVNAESAKSLMRTRIISILLRTD